VTKSWRLNMVFFFSTTLLALLVSQALNAYIFVSLPEHQTWKIFEWLNMTHIRNHGGVFGIFQGQSVLFSLLSGTLLLALMVYLMKSSHIRRFEYIGFGFILGGGISNILDRIFYGSVIDYFDIRGIPHWHYIFNLADVMIHVGLWSMVVIGLFVSYREKKALADEEKNIGLEA